MAEEIRLPPLGQTSDEMSIVEWYKKVGDTIKIAEPLLCVETDKAQVDVESAEEGVVLKIVAQPGESLSSGALLAWVGAPGETVPVDSPADATTVEAMSPEAQPSTAPASIMAVESEANPKPAGRQQVSPVVRKLAATLNVDLASVSGTGPGGRIERVDVEAAAAGHAPLDAAPESTAEVSAMRRAIARRLTRSVQTIPQFTVDANLDARAARHAIADSGVEGLTYTHLLLRAIARAARENPSMLRIWSDEGPSFRVIPTPDIGLAVAGEDSLNVVTIEEPDRATLAALVADVRAAVERGRSGTLKPQDQKATALSVSNLGMFGVDSFHAIIDPEQTAIVAVGSVQDRVVAIDGKAVVVPQVTVSVSCDHRAVDGAQAAKFLKSVRTYFETDLANQTAPA